MYILGYYINKTIIYIIKSSELGTKVTKVGVPGGDSGY